MGKNWKLKLRGEVQEFWWQHEKQHSEPVEVELFEMKYRTQEKWVTVLNLIRNEWE